MQLDARVPYLSDIITGRKCADENGRGKGDICNTTSQDPVNAIKHSKKQSEKLRVLELWAPAAVETLTSVPSHRPLLRTSDYTTCSGSSMESPWYYSRPPNDTHLPNRLSTSPKPRICAPCVTNVSHITGHCISRPPERHSRTSICRSQSASCQTHPPIRLSSFIRCLILV